MITPKDSDINVNTLNIEEAKSPAISGLLKQLIVKPVIEPQVKEGKKDKKCMILLQICFEFQQPLSHLLYGEIYGLNLYVEQVC